MENQTGIKIPIIGAGQVGASVAFAIMSSGLASDLILVDVNKDKARGEALDLGDAAVFTKPTGVIAGDFEDCRDAHIILFTAGSNQKPGQSRLDLLQKNFAILKESLPRLLAHCPEALLIMVANPVDIMTYAALKISGLPANRVFGAGTVLDSSRFRTRLADYCGVDPRNVHAFIVGEHGDSEVALWSSAKVSTVDMDDFCLLRGLAPLDHREISRLVRTRAAEIIQLKGATYYAIAFAVKRICEAVIRDENSILTVSGLVDHLYGIEGCCLSLPCIINGRGRSEVIPLPMSVEEEEGLKNSARILKGVIQELGI